MIPLIFFWCICYPKLVGAQTLGPLPRAAPRDNWMFWLCTICCFLWYLVEPRSASKGILCWFGLFWLHFFGGNPANPKAKLPNHQWNCWLMLVLVPRAHTLRTCSDHQLGIDGIRQWETSAWSFQPIGPLGPIGPIVSMVNDQTPREAVPLTSTRIP